MNSGIPTIDKIYVINLNHNTDRLHNFSTLMKKLGYKFERFEAVNGQLYKPEYLSPGEYGCLISHKTLWERVANDDTLNKVIIFEDDADISDKLIDNMGKAAQLIKHYVTKYSYDIFYLGKCLDRCDMHISQGQGVVRSFKPLCAHAYVITKQGAKKLLEQLETDEFRHTSDVLINLAIKNQNMLVYAAHPSIFNQNTSSFDSNMRSKLSMMILNTKECCIPQCANYIYIFLVLIALVFLIIAIIWSRNRRR